MATRDIQVQKANQPLVGSASGFSGANYTVEPDVAFNPMDVISGFTETVHGIMGEAKANAFMQGQADMAADMRNMGNTVDSAAALIEGASWVTKESYTQGVRYQQYSESQLEVQQEIAAQAMESADKGEGLDVFSQKIKPSLAKLNKQINDLGLTGKAKEDAQQQLLGYVTAAQQQYQKQREAVLETNYQTALNQNAAAGFQILASTTGALESHTALADQAAVLYNTAYEYNPAKAAVNAGKQTQSMLNSMLYSMNPMSDVDLERLAGYSSYLRTDDSINIPSDIRQSMLKSITDTYTKFQEANTLTVGNQLRELETAYNSTGTVSQDVMQQTASTIVRMGQLGQLKPRPVNSQLDRLHKLGLKVDRELGTKELLRTANADTRRAYGIKDSDQTAEWQSTFTQQAYAANRPEMAGSLTVHAGKQYQNYTAIEAGHKQLSGNYVSALTMKPAEFDTYTDKGLAQRSFAEDKRLYTEALLANDPFSSAYQRKGWTSTLGADGAATMDVLMQDPSVQTIEDVQQRYPIVLQQIQDSKAAGKLGNVTISTDVLESPLYGQLLGLSSTLGAELGKGADEYVMNVKRDQLQILYNNNKQYLVGKHSISSDDGGKSALKAMVMEGLITRTDYGVTMMDNKTRYILGNGVYASDDSVNRLDTAIRQKVLAELGPGASASLENMQIRYTAANATVQVYTDNTFSPDTLIDTIQIPRDELRTLTKAALQEETKVVRPIGELPAPGRLLNKTSTTYEDTGVFGGNSFKRAALARIANDEGYFDRVTQPDPAGHPDTYVVGHSVSKDTYVGMFGEEKWNNFVVAASDPYSEQYGRMYDEFVTKYFAELPELVQTSGLPVKTVGSNTSLEVLASTYYHGPASGRVFAQALRTAKDGDVKKAISMVQATPAYKQAGPKRKADMLAAIDAAR